MTKREDSENTAEVSLEASPIAMPYLEPLAKGEEHRLSQSTLALLWPTRATHVAYYEEVKGASAAKAFL